MRIRCVGHLLKARALRSAVTIRFCWVCVLNPSLGEVFGSKRFLPELHSLFGLQL